MSNAPTNAEKAPNRSSSNRLDRTTWIKAAMSQLALGGIEGVRVEVLARYLNVTKGSFYAHFKDRDDLHEAMLGYWRTRATLALIDRTNQIGASPGQRLEHLIHLVIETKSRWGDDAELAIRLWAKRDLRAERTLAEVDEMRVVYIATLLLEAGLDQDDARARALLIYAFMRVSPSLSGVAGESALQRARSMLLAGTNP